MRTHTALPVILLSLSAICAGVASGQTPRPPGTTPLPAPPPSIEATVPPSVPTPPAPPPLDALPLDARPLDATAPSPAPPLAQHGGPAPMTRALVCNDLRVPFGLSVDARRFETVSPGGCRMARVTAGTHLFTPRGRPDAGPWFAHPAWQVDIPADGAVLRFGVRAQGQVAQLIEVLRGLPTSKAQAQDPPDEQPIYLGPASELAPRGAREDQFGGTPAQDPYGPQQTMPLSPWQLCAPMGVPLSVMVDGSPAFSLLGGACGAAYLPYGYHTFAYLNGRGGYYCPPHVGHAGPRGGMVGATPNGVVPVPPRWRGFPMRPSVRVDTGRTPRLTAQPRSTFRPLGPAQAQAARMQARQVAFASRRIDASRNPRPWPSSGPAWARHRRDNSGWVVPPRGQRVTPARRFAPQPRRYWRTPSGRLVYAPRNRPARASNGHRWRGRPTGARPYGATWRGAPARGYRGGYGGGSYRGGYRGSSGAVRSTTPSSGVRSSPGRSSGASSGGRSSGTRR